MCVYKLKAPIIFISFVFLSPVTSIKTFSQFTYSSFSSSSSTLYKDASASSGFHLSSYVAATTGYKQITKNLSG